MTYDTNSHTSEDERQRGAKPRDESFSNLPHSSNRLSEPKNKTDKAAYEKETETEEGQSSKHTESDDQFKYPRKFSSNFHKLVREKSRQMLIPTNNSYQVLTYESDSDSEDDIGKIVKKRKKGKQFKPVNVDDLPTTLTEGNCLTTGYDIRMATQKAQVRDLF